MKNYFAATAVAALIALGAPAGALAGGALATPLLPTADAIDCAAATPCESDGSGAVATLKVKGTNNMSFSIEGALPLQTYSASHDTDGLGSCGDIIHTFNTLADGTADFTVALLTTPDLGDVVEICRQDEFGIFMPVYSGTLTRLNGRG